MGGGSKNELFRKKVMCLIVKHHFHPKELRTTKIKLRTAIKHKNMGFTVIFWRFGAKHWI